MKRFQVLMALIIGFSVVFVMQNGLNKNWNNPSSDSPSIGPPIGPQTNAPSNQPPNLSNNKQNSQSKKLPNKTTKPTHSSNQNLEKNPTQNLPVNDTTEKPVNDELSSDYSGKESISDSSDYETEQNKNEAGEKEITEHHGEHNETQEQQEHHENHEHGESHDEHEDSEETRVTNSHREHQEHHENHEHDELNNEHNEHESTGSNIQPLKFILLVSYFRSGSSFVGDLLQQPNQTFYTYEPLKYFESIHEVDNEDSEEEAIRILQNIFECSIHEEEEYSAWMCNEKRTQAGFSINRNHFLWKSCNSNAVICCDTDYVDQVCSQTRTRIIKTTRISLESVEKLLKRLPKSIDLKVVFLVRDPRGINNSRKHFRWCKTTTCIDHEKLCEDLTSDLKVYPRLVETYGNRVMIARFEDIAINPVAKGEVLYKSLGLPFDSEIIDFIESHTNENTAKPDDSFSVIHNPREVITKWIDKLNETIVNEIQTACEFVFEQLGYKPVVLSEMVGASDVDLNEIYDSVYSLPNRL